MQIQVKQLAKSISFPSTLKKVDPGSIIVPAD